MKDKNGGDKCNECDSKVVLLLSALVEGDLSRHPKKEDGAN